MTAFDFIFKVFVPIGLMLIMFGMGLELKLRDFKQLLIDPKAVTVGIAGQLLLLPILGFTLVALLPMPPAIAVGIILLVACPGGVTSNAVVFSAGGDTVLSVALTAFNSAVTVFTIPFIVGMGLAMFPGEYGSLALDPVSTMAKLAMLCIVPVAIGMTAGHLFPALRRYSGKFFKRFSSFMLAFLLIVVFASQHEFLLGNIDQTWLPVLLLTGMCMGSAWLACQRLSIPLKKSTTLIVEIGLQNSNLASLIAISLLGDPQLAVSPSVYGVLSFLIVAIFATWRSRQMQAQVA